MASSNIFHHIVSGILFLIYRNIYVIVYMAFTEREDIVSELYCGGIE
jgi:hypothetical protein